MATITDDLIRFAGSEVPQDAAAMMRLSLFDWAACGIAGAREEEFFDVVQIQMALSKGANSVLGGGGASAPTAALINGMLSHALDYDDTHFAHIGHPSVAVVPAVLALAEDIGADLSAVVEAATIGVEASILTGLWLGRDHYQVGYHQTATAGAFGATLAACRLLALGKGDIRHALGLSTTMASGLKSQFGTMGKPLNAGLAARTGVEAAIWAQAGMTSAADGMAGPLGFAQTHHGSGDMVKRPGKAWRILEISHKFHACCHGLHAMLEALRDVDIAVEKIDAVHIRTHPRWMSVCNISDPQTGLEAKFSYRQTAAMSLLGHDTGAIKNFSDDLTQAPEVMALRDRIKVTEDTSLGETQAEVSLRLENGAVRRVRHDLLAPMPFDTRAEKVRAKAEGLLGEGRAAALWQAVHADTLADFTDQLAMS